MLPYSRVDAKTGPDSHGTVVIECPYCGLDHHYCFNAFRDNSEMTRPAGCRLSKEGLVVITLALVPAPTRGEATTPLVPPVPGKGRHKFTSKV